MCESSSDRLHQSQRLSHEDEQRNDFIFHHLRDLPQSSGNDRISSVDSIQKHVSEPSLCDGKTNISASAQSAIGETLSAFLMSTSTNMSGLAHS